MLGMTVRTDTMALNVRTQIKEPDRSLIQSVEGSLATINEMLMRLSELLVAVACQDMQIDRRHIQDEIDQLLSKINAVAYTTDFDMRTLIDGFMCGGDWHTIDEVVVNVPALFFVQVQG